MGGDAADLAERQEAAPLAQSADASTHYAPSAWYTWTWRLWGIGFWVAMLAAAIPGMLVKGIVEVVNECRDPAGGGGAHTDAPALASSQKEIYPDWCGTWWYWVEYAAIVLALGLCEGYQCFQKSFSPTLVRRAFEMSRLEPGRVWMGPVVDWVCAPLLAPGFLHATRKRIVMNWTVAVGVLTAIFLMVHYCPEPHRAFIDTGVALGLSWGLAVMVYYTTVLCRRPVESVAFPPKVTGDYPEKHYSS